MPFSRRTLRAAAAVTSFLLPSAALALEQNKPLHYSADKQNWDRRLNRHELFGHAIVQQPGETLSADYILLDLNARTLDAKENCIYLASDSTIYGEEMHFNLDTRTGTIVAGRVSNDRFTLSGERINKLGEGRFQTHWGEYSTCVDCPGSWSFLAEDVDMQFEGYAFMSNVTPKVKDVPALWLPYLVVPMKSRRQTGFLFPEFATGGNNGFQFVEPFFWAINRSADMTIGVGEWTARGTRVEWEGRYALSPRSGGTANFYYVHDASFPQVMDRWAVNVLQTQELPWHLEEKLRLTEVSDNPYPRIIGDVPGTIEPVIPTDIILSRGSTDISAYVAVQRLRNLITLNPDPTYFDPTTVQVVPTVVATTNDKFIPGTPVAGGLTLGVTNFTRFGAGPFDYDPTSTPGNPYRPGIDPIREATRVSFAPTLYTTFRPFDMFSVVPSLTYNGYFYSFHNAVNNLFRGYLLFQTDLSTQLERIYDTGDPNIPRVKHLIRPLLTYSYIPEIREDLNHPFIQQIYYGQANNNFGYNFDDYDIIPLDNACSGTDCFYGLGNSLAYGFTTQLIRRRAKVESETPTYQTVAEVSAGQAFNFRELQQSPSYAAPNYVPNQPFSRLFSSLNLNFDRFQHSTVYYYYPYITGVRHQVTTSNTFILERALHQRIMQFDRSITLAGTWNQVIPNDTLQLTALMNFSINDYLLPSVSATYDFVQHAYIGAAASLQFQSPSRCWRVALSTSYSIQTHIPNWSEDISLNLTGSGYGGVTDVQSQLQH